MYKDKDIKRMLRKAKRKSIRYNRRNKLTNKKNIKHKTDKKETKQKRKSLATVILFAIAITLGTKVISDINYKGNIIEARQVITTMIQERMFEEGFGYYDLNNDFILNNNSIEKYNELGLDYASLGTIYAYEKAMNNNEEFEKLVQSINYDKDNTFSCVGFTTEDQNSMANIMNCINEKTGKPDPIDYYNKATEEIVDAYKNDELEDIIYNNQDDIKLIKRN